MRVDGGIGDIAHAAVGARAAEAAGFDGVWSAETSHDPFLPLLLAAQETETLELGTGIAVAFARNPMTLAHLGHDLQVFSEGRFLLGLGSQIRPHITRRFSMPWDHPAPRMRELILAMRAIWACWNDGSELSFEGEFYTHTLMTPFFQPDPSPFGPPRVFLAGVGPKMTEVAGEVADGLLAHGFTTASYLEAVTLPALRRGAERAGRPRADVAISLPAFVVTGSSDEEVAAAAAAVRGQIAFYGSTPAYVGVLEHHGWGDLQGDLNALSKQGRWKEMGTLIDDEVLDTFAVVSEPGQVAAGLLARFGDAVDRISFYAPYRADEDMWSEIRRELQAA